MTKPSEAAHFAGAGVTVINLGDRGRGVFLTGRVITADVPIALAPMPQKDADWIAMHLLTRTYLESCGGV